VPYAAPVAVVASASKVWRLLLAPYYGLDHLIRELMKFGVVGTAAYLIDAGVNNLLRQTEALDDRPLTAKGLSVAFATLFAFFGNRFWTFRHRSDPGLARGLALFFFLNFVGLLIAVGCLAISHYVLGFTSLLADNVAGNIIGTGLGTLFRFWSYRKWVFRAVDMPGTASGAARAPNLPADRPARIPGQPSVTKLDRISLD
jgi:putative flippase GtrA